jgi:hypothetical protein
VCVINATAVPQKKKNHCNTTHPIDGEELSASAVSSIKLHLNLLSIFGDGRINLTSGRALLLINSAFVCIGRNHPQNGDIVVTDWGSTTDGTTTLRHTGHITTHYMIYHPFDWYFR